MQKKVHVKSGDQVISINGKYRGKKGKVMQVSPSEGKVIVDGVNIVTKHVKPKKMGEPGGLIKAESALYASKVQLICPKCGGTMKIIAFIDEGEVIREILTHLGEPVDPPRIAPAHGPPLWEAAGQCGDELLIQPLPEFEFDQRIAW